MFKQIAVAAREVTVIVDPKATPSRASLPIFAADKPPARTDRLCDIEIPKRVWSNIKIDGELRAIIRALTVAEQGALAKRQGEIVSALVPFTEGQTDRVVVAISDMFGGFRSVTRNIDPEHAVAMADGIRRMLTPLPAWAIEEGCRAIQRGKSGLDHKFLPNDNEVYEVVDRLVQPYRARLMECESLLEAPVEDSRRFSKTG